MTDFVNVPWQGGDQKQSTRIWAHLSGGAVIIADFDASDTLRHETKVANARRARNCVNFCAGVDRTTVEALLGRDLNLDKVLNLLARVTAVCAGMVERDGTLSATLDEAQAMLRAVGRTRGDGKVLYQGERE